MSSTRVRKALSASVLVGLCLLSLLWAGTAAADEPAAAEGKVVAVLLNGGAKPKANFLSHFEHIQEIRQVLLERGVAEADIAVFNADGERGGADMATREVMPAPKDFWLVSNTAAGRSLRPRVEMKNTAWKGVELKPATKKALRSHLLDISAGLKPGDTLLVYVTDHGQKGKKDLDDGTISMWNETMSVRELREIFGVLHRDVRIIMMMSQCFSGTFASVMYPAGRGIPSGNTCGFFSTTRDRLAYGCYPEGRAQQRLGHAYTIIDALAGEDNLEAVHDRTALLDGSPDVPLRTSDVFVEKVLAKIAKQEKRSLQAVTDDLLSRAFEDKKKWSRDIVVLDELGQKYGLLSPRSLGEAEAVQKALNILLTELRTIARRWNHSFGDLRTSTMARFLASSAARKARWPARLNPKRLKKAGSQGKAKLLAELLDDLKVWLASDDDRFELLRSFNRSTGEANAAKYRMEVRYAVALRMRARLLNIAGRAMLQDESAPVDEETRAALEALLGCEAFEPGGAPRTDAPKEIPTLPALADEIRTISELRPAYLGVKYRATRVDWAAGRKLPGGTVELDEVLPDTPASRAGLRRGDLITGLVGRDFVDANALRHEVMVAPLNKPVPMRVVRKGKAQRRTIRLVPWPMKKVGFAASSRVGDASPKLASLEYSAGAAPARGVRHVLYFWSSTCNGCTADLQRLAAWSAKSGVAVISVTDDQIDGGAIGSRLAFARDPERKAFMAHGINGNPTIIVVDEGGTIRHRRVGLPDDFDMNVWRGGGADPH